jgi:hypothetical protein
MEHSEIPERSCRVDSDPDSIRATLAVSVMAGLVPAIHDLRLAGAKTWMPGTRPGMTAVASLSI